MLAVLVAISSWIVHHPVWSIVIGLALGLLIRALTEPTRLEITQTTLVPPDPVTHQSTRPALAPASPPASPSASPSAIASTSPNLAGPQTSQTRLRVALLSDLHAEWLRIHPAQLAEALAAQAFDVLLFAGDLTGRYHRPDRAQPWLTGIAELIRQKNIPSYAVPGNHDSPESLALLRQAGFHVLVNDTAVVADPKGLPWLLIGLDILKKGQPDFGKALDKTSPEALDIPSPRRLVLAHNPDTLFQIPSGQARFFLAGHFHGGQIYLPFHLEFFLLRREKLGRMGYHRGCFVWQGVTGYISRGLGSVLFPLRLGSIPELPILELLASVDAAATQSTP